MLTSDSPALAAAAPQRRPLTTLLLIWLKIGATSFGGGAATQQMIYQNFVLQRKWLSEDEFAQDWALVQFAPGINLIAMAALIGSKLGGGWGVAASLFGMLFPAVAITIAMTALYASIRALPAAQSALRGITPAIVGLSLAFTWRLLKPAMGALRVKGSGAFVLGAALVGVVAVMTAAGLPILIGYAVGAVTLALAYAWWARARA